MKTMIFVIGAAMAAGQSARVEGRVVSVAGEALGKVQLRLAVASVATDSDGGFVFENIAPGRYMLAAEKAGFKTEDNGVSLNLREGMELKDLVIKMTPQGVIAGRVTDQDGDPVAKVNVSAMRYDYVRGRRQLASVVNDETNDRGDYRLADLAPGRYYIRATMPPEIPVTRRFGDLPGRAAREGAEGNVATFYPSAPDGPSALALEITPGLELRGTDVRLRRVRVYSVKGKMVNASDGSPAVACLLQLMADGENRSLARVQPDGTFEFRGLQPGRFELSANQICAGFTPLQEVNVNASNVYGVEASLLPIAPIPGRITVEDGDLPRVGVGLVGPAGGSSRQVGGDGTFELPSTGGAGRFSWSVGGLPEGTYVKSVQFAGRDVTRAPVDNTSGAGGPLEIVLSNKAASLSGTAPKGTMVRIWPKIPDLGSYGGGLKATATDQDGGFEFTGLAPGEYFVAAWEELDTGLAQDPEFLALFSDDASNITLAESERGSVEAKLIPSEKIAAQIAKLP